MTERPIIFSAPMVRAILEGRKSQTRRRGKRDFLRSGIVEWAGREMTPVPSYAPGDRLWVRETWRVGLAYDDLTPSELSGEEIVDYVADSTTARWSIGRTRSPIHMPRWASRSTLTVTDVRVQRLQEISQEDALAEGAPPSHPSIDAVSKEFGYPDFTRSWFAQLWEHIHGPGSWGANPWVAAISFERTQ